LKANDARREAEAAQDEANKARGEAAEQTRLAGLAAEDAQQKGLLAAEKTRLAGVAARHAEAAEAARVVAQAEAERQQAIAEVRSLANQSQALLRQRPDEARRSLSLAVDSMKKAVAAGIRSVEADAALRDSLAVLPRLQRINHYVGPRDFFIPTALSPDGRYLATCIDKKLRVYESGSETPLKEGTCDRKEAISLSSGAAYVAVGEKVWPRGNIEQYVRIIDLKDDARSHTIKLEEFAEGFALSPGGRYLAYYNPYSTVRVLEAESGKPVATLDNDGMFSFSIDYIAFGPSGNLAVSGGFIRKKKIFGRAIIWWLPPNPKDGKTEHDLTQDSFFDFEIITQSTMVTAVAPGTDNTYFATDDAVWKRFPGQAGYEPVTRLPPANTNPPNVPIERMAFSPDGKSLSLVRYFYLDSKTSDRTFEVWDTTGYRDVIWETYGGWNGISGLAFKPGSGGHFIATAAFDNSTFPERLLTRVFQGDPAEASDTIIKLGEADVQTFDRIPKADYFFTTKGDAVMVWDVWGRRTMQVPTAPGQIVRDGAVGHGGKFLALSGGPKGSERPEVVVYHLEEGSYSEWKRLHLPDTLVWISLSADGQVLTGLYKEGLVRVLDVSSGRDVTPDALKKLTEVGHLQISPGGRYLLAGDEGKRVLLCDLSNGRNVSLPFDATLQSVAFSPDDRYLALGSEEGLAYVFETARPEEEIARLQHTGSVTAVAFSDDDKYVATVSRIDRLNDLMHVWLLQPADLLAEAAAR
jgi:WD40 repeat protein